MVVLENGYLRIYKTDGEFGASLEHLIPEQLKTQVTIIGPQIIEATEKAHQPKIGKLMFVSSKQNTTLKMFDSDALARKQGLINIDQMRSLKTRF